MDGGRNRQRTAAGRRAVKMIVGQEGGSKHNFGVCGGFRRNRRLILTRDINAIQKSYSSGIESME